MEDAQAREGETEISKQELKETGAEDEEGAGRRSGSSGAAAAGAQGEDDDEEEGCGFCKFMRAGPCGHVFTVRGLVANRPLARS